jgi:acyl-CoA thioester hydrolase
MNLPNVVAGHPLQISLPVQWGDQDAFAHVNNVVYFRWIESARIEYFRRAGLQELMAKQGTGSILASVKCDYRRQLTYPDTLLVTASIASVGRTSMKMVHELYSESQKTIAAEGDSVIVLFDYAAQKPVVIGDELRAKIDQFEGQGK